MDDKVLFLCIGLILGYIAGTLTNTAKNRVERGEPMTPVTQKKGSRVSRLKLVLKRHIPSQVPLFLVLCLTVYATVITQINNNNLAEQQRENDKQQECNTQFQAKVLDALNSRTKFSVDQSFANFDVLVAQQRFLTVINPASTLTPAQYQAAFNDYNEALDKAQQVTGASKTQITFNAYPTLDEFRQCLRS